MEIPNHKARRMMLRSSSHKRKRKKKLAGDESACRVEAARQISLRGKSKRKGRQARNDSLDDSSESTNASQCIDAPLLAWLRLVRLRGFAVDDETLSQKAAAIAAGLKLDDGSVDSDWLQRWKERHSIQSLLIRSKNQTVNMDLVREWRSTKLSAVLRAFAPQDIYNVDEMGLLWKVPPDKMLSFEGDDSPVTKTGRDRITVLVGSSMTGEKLPLLLVGKSQNPRCFKNENLPSYISYRANQKAWMTSHLWTEWISQFDLLMRQRDRFVALVIDNCSAHCKVSGLSNVMVVPLPAKTTSVTQPMDCGVIDSLKCRYKSLVTARRLRAIEENSSFNWNLLDAVNTLVVVWESVTPEEIQSCFRSCGFEKITSSTNDSYSDPDCTFTKHGKRKSKINESTVKVKPEKLRKLEKKSLEEVQSPTSSEVLNAFEIIWLHVNGCDSVDANIKVALANVTNHFETSLYVENENHEKRQLNHQ